MKFLFIILLISLNLNAIAFAGNRDLFNERVQGVLDTRKTLA